MRAFQVIAMLILILVCSEACYTYPVGQPLKLNQIVQESDVIFKAKAGSSDSIEDDWFQEYRGFDAHATSMHIISVIKGNILTRKAIFRHYGLAKDFKGGFSFMPQIYRFEANRPYIVFAKNTDREGVFRQLWKYHKQKEDQGVVLAADDQPIAQGKSVKEVIWSELNKLLVSKDPKDVVYAIRQLDEMSNMYKLGGGFTLEDFDRDKVLDAVASLMFSKEKEIAIATIRTIGAVSPYIYRHNEVHWLATVGAGNIRGIGKRDANVKNEDAGRYWKDLVAVADGDGPMELRALAIRALGREGETRTFEAASHWVKEPEPLIRQAGAILLSDFPGRKASHFLKKLSGDDASEVKVGVARAIGYGQFSDLLPVLNRLIQDENADVSTAAALSLLSFAPARAERVLKANLDHPDFKSVFVNALAEANPEPYLDSLVEIIEKKLEPHNFWGGQIPYWTSWQILFKYIRGLGDESLRSGNLDKYLDVLENAQMGSSGPPRDLYALYVRHKMMERARRFREKCKTTIRFDMENYFKKVDKQYGIDTSKHDS